MDLTIKYIGNDHKYWTKIKQKFASDYGDFNLHFLFENIEDGFNPRISFVKTYHENPNIVYVDFSTSPDKCLYFCKLFNRNNVTRLSSLVALHNYAKGWDPIKRTLLASVRINHFKTFEVNDVVYDPVSLLNVEMAKDPQYIYGRDLGKYHLKHILRLAYIEDDCLHIETNSKLPMEEIIQIDQNPIQELVPSHRVFVKNFSDTNLYYNSRFGYDLEFSFFEDDFFKATEESWLLYKIYKDNPLGYKEETGKRYEDLEKDIEKRKNKIIPVKEKLQEWIEEKAEVIRPKKVKIMVVDDTMEIFTELNQRVDSFPYSINIQNKLMKDFYQINRTKPHLIVIHCDQENNMTTISRLIEFINDQMGYEPYLLVFNVQDASQLKKINYEHLLTFKKDVHLDTIAQLAQKMDEKLHYSESKERVYFQTSSAETVMTYTREVKVLAMTESIIYFESELEIPMWTTFIMSDPTQMLVTVIPHRSSGEFRHKRNCYRAMINALGEREKKILRRAVNKSLAYDED